MTKHEDKEHRKTLKQEAPRSVNHKTTQNNNNTGTTALDFVYSSDQTRQEQPKKRENALPQAILWSYNMLQNRHSVKI